MDAWRSAVTDAGDDYIRVRGYDVVELMRHRTFADTLFLLHQARLPSNAERELIDAILIASADHGPGSPSAMAARLVASGNRRAPEAGVAAGILSIGDVHGGAGERCMVLLGEGIERQRSDGQSVEQAAAWIVDRARQRGERLPGLGHRSHRDEDPRAAVLFGMAQERGLAGDGIALLLAVRDAVAAHTKALPINVDGALGAVLLDLGFAPSAARFFFIVGRVAGLTAQVAEEIERERPMRVRVPVTYDGPEPRALPGDDD